MTEVRFDFPLVPADLSFGAIRQLAQEAESLGYEMISVSDHLVRDQPLFEQWTTLAFIASCTATIKIGSLITIRRSGRPSCSLNSGQLWVT